MPGVAYRRLMREALPKRYLGEPQREVCVGSRRTATFEGSAKEPVT
jgi:hypothetical protein